MILDVAVDLNVLSYPVPIIMRERGEVVRRDETSLRTSDEARSVLGRRARRSLAFIRGARPNPQPSGEAELAHGHRARRSLYLGGRARWSLALSPRMRWNRALSPRARQSRSPAVRRGGVGPRASGEVEQNSRRSGKKRSSALVRSGVFNVRWLLVPPPWVPRY